MGQKRAKLSEQIRRAVDASGLGHNEIGRMLNIDKGLMSRFMNGKGGLAMASLDALADLLRLQLKPTPKGRKRTVKHGNHRD